jgi:precorrin-3B synthase
MATEDLARALGHALAGGPDLPSKFGFAVDTGLQPVLAGVSADIRLERDAAGGLILRCDGMPLGAPVSEAAAPGAAVALARWFQASGGVSDGRGRMAALIARGARPEGATVAPAPAEMAPGPGLCPEGALVGFEFGQMRAETLMALARLGDIRVTPWRMLLIEGLRQMPAFEGLILTADNPLRRVIACTGAPGCLQAQGAVRPLARRLAAQVPEGQTLHVAGCAKGCAHPGMADVTLVATAHGFDRIVRGCAQDAPEASGLAEAAISLEGLF